MDLKGTANTGKPSDYSVSVEKCDEASSTVKIAQASALSMAFPMIPPTESTTMSMPSNISLFHNALLAAGDLNEIESDRKTQSRKNRLEQNRKAARESRRRKKMMIDELQRSVIFFTRANAVLRQQNIDLLNRTTEAQRIVTAHEFAKLESTTKAERDQDNSEQGSESPFQSSSMRIGATMKAMASFQEAASAAMQSAMKGLGGTSAQHLGEPCDEEVKQAVADATTGLTCLNPIEPTISKGQYKEDERRDNDPERTTD